MSSPGPRDRQVRKTLRCGFPRIASVEPCDVEYQAQRQAATTWNISVRGVYLVIDPVPAVDARIRLSLRLPGGDEPVRAIGRIAWLNPRSRLQGTAAKVVSLPPGCGVEFLAIAEQDRRRIQAHVEAASGPGPAG